MQDNIVIKGAREHNLKNISLSIPRNKLVVFTGLSGSGKSSLAFDTIFAEGQRRYVESLSAYARQFLGQMDKPDVDEIEGLSPAISIDQKAHSANPRSTVATITEIYDYLRVLYARVGKPHCVVCGKPIRKLTVEEMVNIIIEKENQIHSSISDEVGAADSEEPRAGARKRAPSGERPGSGAGTTRVPRNGRADFITVLAPVVRGRKGEYYQLLYDLYNAGFSEVRVDGKVFPLRERINLSKNKAHTIELIVDRVPLAWPLRDNKAFRQQLAEALEIAIEKAEGNAIAVYGDGTEQNLSARFSCPDDGFAFPEIEPRLFSFNSPYGACEACHGLGTEEIWSEIVCPKCHGKRLREESLHVTIGRKNIVQATAETIEAAHDFFSNLKLSETDAEIASPVLKEILARLQFMLNVGLHYLTLDRKAGTLSGGEAQRIRLASQLGSRLTGATYVLDEPTIGLHQRDNEKLVKTLLDLRDLGNSIIVVEHDEATIWSADHLVDIGPGAGKHGGYIVMQGPMPDVLASKEAKNSLTAKYLNGELSVTMPEKRRQKIHEKIKIIGASENNLKNIDVEIPLRKFICVTGVSGSGKSTLVEEVLNKTLAQRFYGSRAQPGKNRGIVGLEWLDKSITIDQSPIGRTPRSNPATYTGIWTWIRDLYAQTPEARVRGYKPGRFSFNVPGGRCENCEGHGMIAIEMHFLPTVWVKCDVCKGRRFDRETLEVKYKDKSIHDVLTMTVEDADDFFRDIPIIHDKLKVMKEVGLGYVELGQPAPQLSGGEAQRVKLATELAKRGTGRTLYILDEPTVGLHFEDVRKLVEMLQSLVAKGNTVLVIEHNLDIIKNADWIIDLGPEGGDKGGQVVAEGTPEEVARRAGSYTGKYLRKVLAKK
jgi:excinuclease ABC subunit A